jgi:hypothetical protein
MTVSLHKVEESGATQAGHDAVGPEQPVEPSRPTANTGDIRSWSGDRHYYLAVVTRKLVIVTLISLVAIGIIFYGLQAFGTGRSFLVLIIFAVGLIGGFVSLQQRLPKASMGDLKRLSETWFAILLVPINGGIFAIVLHVAFLGKILQGDVFPTYLSNREAVAASGAAAVTDWLKNIAPASSTEFGKLLFWAFVAGFSERLVPQILQQRVGVAESEERETRSKPEAPPDQIGQDHGAAPKTGTS